MRATKYELSKKMNYYLVLLFGLEYFSVYHIQFLTPLLAFAVVVYSYYMIIHFNCFAPVLMLILSARVINGFIITGVSWAYTLFMVVTYYFPTLIFIVRNLRIKNGTIRYRRETVKTYKFAILYTVIYTFLFIINIRQASSLLLESILPIVLFVICIVFIPRESFLGSLDTIIMYLKLTFILSLVLYVLPHYAEITSELVKSGKPFGVSVEATGTLVYLGIFRNNGIFFDCRILGIFTYIYIYLVGQTREKINVFDVALSGVTVFSTLSRGGIVGYLIVLFGYLIICENTKSKYLLLGIGGLSLVSVIALYIPAMSDVAIKFFSTFNLKQSYNVLTQRSVMSDYAINAFYQHPILGGGIGSLTADDANRVVFTSSYVTYNVVTDAYLFSLLGEIGLLGTGLFILQFYRIIVAYSNKHLLSIMLFLGMVVHLVGTDIPRMRLVYFAVLMMISIGNWSKNTSPLTDGIQAVSIR